MLKHIIYKEIQSVAASPGMAISFVIILLVMTINGLVFSVNYKQQRKKYNSTVVTNEAGLQSSAQDLSVLAFYKQTLVLPPSQLGFIFQDQTDKLPNAMEINYFSENGPMYLKPLNDYLSSFRAVDWSFIFIFIISFICMALAYNRFSGEKEKGTLRLILSNSVPRSTIVIGKLTGVFICISIPVLLGLAVCLLTITLLSGIALTLSHAAVILIFTAAAALFILLNVLMGFLFSCIFPSSTQSLNLFLVFWILLAVIIPGAAWIIARQQIYVPTEASFNSAVLSEACAIREDKKYSMAWKGRWEGQPPNEIVQRRAAGIKASDTYVMKKKREYMDLRVRQVRRAVSFAKISPYSAFRFLCSGISGNGYSEFVRHYNQVLQYKSRLQEYVLIKDGQDPRSYHLLWNEPWACRTFFSHNPVPYSEIPRFSHKSRKPAAVFRHAGSDLLVLAAWCIVLFTAVWAAFIGYDVR